MILLISEQATVLNCSIYQTCYMTIIDDLKWRYATKKFDSSRRVNDEDLNTIKEAIRLSASSYGLQPYEVLIIEDAETKQSLLEHSYNQSQVVDCSHLFVFCNYVDVNDKIVDSYIQNIATTRNIPLETLTDFKNAILGSIDNKTPAEIKVWGAKQCYLALANLLNACAHLKIDSCPMEGFVPEAYSKMLELEKINLFPSLVAPIGYRHPEDFNAKNLKVRKKTESLYRVLGK